MPRGFSAAGCFPAARFLPDGNDVLYQLLYPEITFRGPVLVRLLGEDQGKGLCIA